MFSFGITRGFSAISSIFRFTCLILYFKSLSIGYFRTNFILTLYIRLNDLGLYFLSEAKTIF